MNKVADGFRKQTMTLNESREKVDRRKMEDEFRKSRIPFHGNKLKLSFPKLKGYRGHWFNDERGKIQDAINAGYQFVDQQQNLFGVGVGLDGNSDLGTRVSKVVGTQENGEPLRAYLMYIREDWWKEDQALKDEPRKETEKAIKRGKHQIGSEEEKMYVPRGGISFGK